MVDLGGRAVSYGRGTRVGSCEAGRDHPRYLYRSGRSVRGHVDSWDTHGFQGSGRKGETCSPTARSGTTWSPGVAGGRRGSLCTSPRAVIPAIEPAGATKRHSYGPTDSRSISPDFIGKEFQFKTSWKQILPHSMIFIRNNEALWSQPHCQKVLN